MLTQRCIIGNASTTTPRFYNVLCPLDSFCISGNDNFRNSVILALATEGIVKHPLLFDLEKFFIMHCRKYCCMSK